MEKHANIRRAARVAGRLAVAGAVVALGLCLPFDWVKLGQAATLLAAGLQQPYNAAAAISEQTAPTVEDAAANALHANAAPSTTTTVTNAVTTVTDSPSLPAVSVTPPKKDGSGGVIYTRQLTSGDTREYGLALRNSSGKTVDIAAALKTPLTPKFTKTNTPQVLIIHTHTTEGYMLYDAGYYNAADRERTHDQQRSVCAVGAALKDTLAAEGIVAIHDTTLHDQPYSGAYTRSAKTVENYLKQYPSIQVVLDLHRDALMEGATGLVKPTVTVNGKKAAQVMLIAGVVSTSALPNPHAAQNFALAAQWQKALTADYAGLMRPLSTVGSRYNQHLHAGYLLVEVGSEANTVAEAVYSAELLGKTLAELLREG